MLLNDIKHWDSKARSKFIYKSDTGPDNWRSHADEVIAGKTWQGDCDDLVSTVLDLLGRAGLPLDQRYRLEVDSRGGSSVNHLIGAALSQDSGFLIVGDTFGSAYPATNMKHIPIEYQRLSEISVVRSGAPWTVGIKKKK